MNNKVKAMSLGKKIGFNLLILLILFFLLFPVSVIVSVSLKTFGDVFNNPATWIPRPFAFENYIKVFEEIPIFQGFINIGIVTFFSISFTMLIAIPAAFAISRLRVYGKKTVMYVVLVCQMFAPVIIIIPLYSIMNKLHLIDSFFSLILMNTVFNLAFIVLMLKGFFDGVPKEVVEAAKIDGCSYFMTLMRIFLPISATGIAVAMIFAFTRTWNEFLFAFTFISTQSKEMLIVGIYKSLKQNPHTMIPWHYIMAASVYATIPLLTFFLSIKKYIMGGMTTGAIK